MKTARLLLPACMMLLFAGTLDANALFKKAKGLGRQLKWAERQADTQEQFLELQQAKLAVTKQLEAALTLQAAGEPAGSA